MSKLKLRIKEREVTDDASIPDLLTCDIKYKIEEAKGTIGYVGPKIPPELWYQITSFFKWTYDTYKSESQVRLFVSPTLGTWKAHAFPQQAKMGTSTVELDNEDAKLQRAALNLNPPDWHLFGTVHHHCSLNAFASGTDEENERNQDGLHITVGHMSSAKYDLHARLIRRGLRVDPDMSWFWDIGNIVDQVPELFKEFIPKDYANIFARRMMCIPVTAEFPQQWKDNYIEIKPPEIAATHPAGGGSQGFPPPCLSLPPAYTAESQPSWKRAQNAWKEILYWAVEKDIEAPDLVDALGDLKLNDFAYNIILRACVHHHILPDDLERQEPVNLMQELAEAQLEKQWEESTRGKQEQQQPQPPMTEGGSMVYNVD